MKFTTCAIDSVDQMPGIFNVGKKTRLMLMTGHHSDEFKEFLTKHFKSLKSDFCYDDTPEFKHENSLDGVNVVCEENLDSLSALLKLAIETEAN